MGDPRGDELSWQSVDDGNGSGSEDALVVVAGCFGEDTRLFQGPLRLCYLL